MKLQFSRFRFAMLSSALLLATLASPSRTTAQTVLQHVHSSCSNASLHGMYAYSGQGFIEVTADVNPSLFVPWAQTGQIVFDGEGTIVSGTFVHNTTTEAGGVIRGTITGTYTIRADCSGAAQVLTDFGGIIQLDVVVQSPTEVLLNATGIDIPGHSSLMIVYSARKMPS